MKGSRIVVLVFALGMLMQLLSLPPTLEVKAQQIAWYDDSWSRRRSVAISCPCDQQVENYQVQVKLDASFDFAKALLDGSDIRITDSDGISLIPFWVEEWNSDGETASIWVKVPSIPLTGTTIYIYYGNPNPSLPAMFPIETPPIGPWDRAVDNPIIPIDDSGNGAQLLAENVVYDDDTGHYWMVFANYRAGSVAGLVWSDDPADANAWHWYGTVVSSANAPHIMEYDGTWYIFYADRAHRASDLPGYSGAYPTSYPISVATASNIEGPYTFDRIVLTSTQPWEAYRVDEPYLFQRNDGKWILSYMGDQGDAVEQVSYAEADDILGPYTKFPGYPADPGGPAIPFGPAGSYDAGTVADPWVVEFHGTYYIGYTVSPTKFSPWQTAYATTTDWQTFTKHGITLPLGPSEAWDSVNSFRGAVTRFGDIYYFPFTGDAYQMGIATQDVWQTPPVPLGPDVVFPFFDDFDDAFFDTEKWVINYGTPSQVSESGGWLTLTAGSLYSKIYGNTVVGMNYLVEARARHPQAGITNRISEVGLGANGFENTVRIVDDFPDTVHWQRQASRTGLPGAILSMNQTSDTDWHILRVYRLLPNLVGYQIDDTPAEVLPDSSSTPAVGVPLTQLPAFLMSYGNGNQFIVDWIRIRQYCGADPIVTVGAPEVPTAVTLISFAAEASVGQVTLTWETATEFDALGFNIYRSDSMDGDYIQVNEFLIPCQAPGAPTGTRYSWVDDEPGPESTHYYKLEGVDLHGGRTTLGLVRATAEMWHIYLPLIAEE